MTARIKPVFYFYRRFLLPSLLFNFLLIFLDQPFAISFALKILFFGLLLFVYLYTKQKNKLIFYQNLSISTPYLFGLSFLMDITLLAITYILIGYAT